MVSETRAITDRVTKQIVTIFSKTCNNNCYLFQFCRDNPNTVMMAHTLKKKKKKSPEKLLYLS